MIGRLAIALAVALVPTAADAQTSGAVIAARGAGVVGERFDGYLGFAATPSPALRAQVNAINIKRRALYSGLAARRGVSAQEVGVTASCALLGRVAVGERYQLSDGQWRRRDAGESAPRPDYCG